MEPLSDCRHHTQSFSAGRAKQFCRSSLDWAEANVTLRRFSPKPFRPEQLAAKNGRVAA